MGIENRKEQRRHIIYYLQVNDPATGASIGRLVDITTIGLMMITEKALEAGARLPLRIVLPPEFALAPFIDVVGQSVWCHKDVNPDYYAVGFQIDQTTENHSKIIRELVDQLGFLD